MRLVVSLLGVCGLGGCGFDVSLPAAIDATEVDVALRVCPPAPIGCVAFTCSDPTSCHYYCSGAKRATEAQPICMQIATGGCLVTLSSPEEDMCVRAAAGTGNLIHIGLYQPSGSQEPAGGWTWRCGTSTFGPRWMGSEPNDGSGGEDCCAMGVAGNWVDVGCSEQFRFVCEVPR